MPEVCYPHEAGVDLIVTGDAEPQRREIDQIRVEGRDAVAHTGCFAFEGGVRDPEEE